MKSSNPESLPMCVYVFYSLMKLQQSEKNEFSELTENNFWLFTKKGLCLKDFLFEEKIMFCSQDNLIFVIFVNLLTSISMMLS